jgi:zinc transport system ATP-binding protein
MMPEPVIAVRDLKFSYDKAPILENVHFTIEPGEFIGIFGPNGGGKTTLLKLLMGMLKPDHGDIELLGKEPQHTRGQIGYVPQILRFDKDFPISVLEVVLMGCLSKLHWWGGFPKGTKEVAFEALQKVGLADFAKASFGTLSGGQAQRALIARAIVNHPKILLLDEPTASVDPVAEQEIHQLLAELNRTMTIVMVTHDLQSIIDKAKRLLCVHRQVTTMQAKEVCEHFALGLYHTPLSSKDHFTW